MNRAATRVPVARGLAGMPFAWVPQGGDGGPRLCPLHDCPSHCPGQVKDDKKKPISTSLQYNEYIVYDTSQLQMKYLLRLKFNYKVRPSEPMGRLMSHLISVCFPWGSWHQL